ncbi:MAG: anhydro-N-acetylmuramic acid kinase [Flavobacteriales bacterium]|jgi:anhydro-N-acetylmuramic acid kinase
MESTRNFRVLGAMSGTSLDGLDLVLVHFEQKSNWKFSIEKALTIPYSKEWKLKLTSAQTCSGMELKLIDLAFSDYCAQAMKAFLDGEQVDFIASHGHTIFHEPERGLTHQIVDPSMIAAVTGCDVIADFRMKDVCLGGQGAPLVPIGDSLLFSEYEACVNIGGFANVSLTRGTNRMAWDISAANIVLNALVQPFGLNYDEEGQLARKGKVDARLLAQFEQLAYFKSAAPKSLGREWVEREITPLLTRDFSTEDLLATFSEHIALRIAADLSLVKGEVLFTGGGVYNSFLMERIQEHGQFEAVVPKAELVEFKEALIFAFLGVLWKMDEPNALADFTGARRNHVSGVYVRGN